MLKRRDFIQRSLALAALAPAVTTASTPLPSEHSGHSSRSIDVVLVDLRYADSRAFAQELQRQGARVIDNREDLGELWYGELGAAFAAAPVRFAGLTPHSDLFVCESCARERGARRVYQGAHDCRGADHLTHSLQFGAPLAGLAAQLALAGRNWPTRLAQQLGRTGRDHPPDGREAIATRAARAPDHPGTLFSWLIA